MGRSHETVLGFDRRALGETGWGGDDQGDTSYY